MNVVAQTASPAPQAFAEPKLARAFLEQWPGATIVLDADFDVRWLNRRAAQWLRSRAESVVARPWHELPLPWRIDRPALEAVRQGAERCLPPADLVDVDGKLHSCAARLMPLQLEGGTAAVLLLIDGAPEPRAVPDSDSRRLRRRDLALASAQVGFWEWNLETGDSSIDAEWCRLLMIDPCPGPGHCEAWAKNIHPDDLPEFRRRLDALGSGEAEQIEIEYRVLTSDYRWVWIMQRGRIVERGAEGASRRVSGICIDIDERKRHEVDLRESESRLANALWGARAALWQWHIPSRVTTQSPMWYAMTGYTEEEWRSVPEPWRARLHPDDQERVAAATREHLEGRTLSLEYEYRILTAAGKWHWMLDRGRIVEWDLDGSPTVAIGVSLDIHAQKEAELRLRASEARLETVVWSAGLGLWEIDFASARMTWLTDWCEQFDLEPLDGDTSVWNAKIHPEDQPEIERRMALQLAGEVDDSDVEFRARTRSGEWKWLLARGRVERAADGTPVRAVGVCMDIDSRKRAELAASEARKRLRLTLQGTRAAQWEWTRGGALTALSRDMYRRMLGLEISQAGEGFWYSRIHPDDLERFRAGTAGVIRGSDESYQIDYRVQHADGTWLWVLDRGRVLERNEAGETVRATGFVLDISENKRTEAALIASEQRFRLATEAVHGMIYEADLSTGAIERHGLERMLGYQPGGLAAARTAWEALVHPDDQRWRTAATYEAIFGTGQTAEIRYRLRHRDGHYIHVWDRAVALRDASGKLTKIVGFAMDISAQVQAQEALRKSEAFHRSVLALTPGFGHEFSIDETGRITVTGATEGFEQVFGCTIEEFERQGGWDAFSDRTSVAPGARRERLLAGEPVVGDVRFRTVAGEWRWLNLTAQPIKHPRTGRVIGGIGSVLDITERKLAEERLRESQSALQTIAESSPDWLLLLDRELRCVFINRSVGRLTPEQIMGQPLGQVDPEPDRSRMRAAAQSVIDTGEPASYTHSVLSADGRRRYFDCRARPVRSGDRIVGVVLNISEITEQRRAEELLRTQAHILETMGEGVVLVDEDDRVRLTNPAFDAMFGYEAGELAGSPIGPLFQLTESHRTLIERRRALVGSRHRGPHEDEAAPIELECVRRDGTRFTADCVITSVEIDGAVHWLAVLADVTAHKHLEREVLEIANREQRRIGSDLHDGLGQDLTGIALTLRAVAAQLRKESPALGREVEEVIRLVNGAIESTRNMASGLSPVSAVRGGLPEALRSLAERSGERFGVQVEFSSQLHVPLAIDENTATQLYRIAQEAITNAIRHGQVSRIELELEVEEDRIHLCIHDDGRGFDPAGSSAGGMGLKIMQYRSQMLRGALDVHAATGQGVSVCCACPHGNVAGVDNLRPACGARVDAARSNAAGCRHEQTAHPHHR